MSQHAMPRQSKLYCCPELPAPSSSGGALPDLQCGCKHMLGRGCCSSTAVFQQALTAGRSSMRRSSCDQTSGAWPWRACRPEETGCCRSLCYMALRY
jgi:hypothetical protein